MPALPKVLPRSFYARSPEEVARELLGKYLVRRVEEEVLVGRIVEVEAYLHEGDEASHRQRGYTERTKSLFGEGGHAYVHSQRHHTLIDIVTGDAEKPCSVLLRALEPVGGIEVMALHRGTESLQNIANGPGKLCQALEITRALDGVDMTVEGPLYVLDGPAPLRIENSQRIGLGKAQELMLRFYIRH